MYENIKKILVSLKVLWHNKIPLMIYKYIIPIKRYLRMLLNDDQFTHMSNKDLMIYKCMTPIKRYLRMLLNDDQFTHMSDKDLMVIDIFISDLYYIIIRLSEDEDKDKDRIHGCIGYDLDVMF